MITNIQIKNFKSLEKIDLDLKPLNIITGANGGGKTSFIQSLLLLRQAYLNNFRNNSMPLNGELTTNLGLVQSIQYANAKDNEIIFGIDTTNCAKLNWLFDASEKASDKTFIIAHKAPEFNKVVDCAIALFSNANFQYISADRITPNSGLGKSPNPIEFKQFGRRGEYAVEYLKERGDEDAVLLEMVYDDNMPPRPLPLIKQVNFWLSEITAKVALDIRKVTDTVYELRYKFNGDNESSFSAINSAYGLTAALPVITALLAAQKGDLVIIENPESDLHPQGQSKMGELIARVAQAGVQVIIETHSDHILNGIRVAVSEKLIENDLIKTYFFYKNKGQQNSNAISIPIDEFGRMPLLKLREEGIEGFFDQINKDYKKIAHAIK
ncbi:MAG: hypothetical protein RLZZ292_2513 [Bacteroidota bacterium]|jgi:predicted ATPase